MIFADAASTTTSTNLFNIAGTVGVAITIIGIAYIVIRGSIYSKNHSIDQQTITTYKNRNDSLSDENKDLRVEIDEWKEKAHKLEGEKSAWQETVTAAPQIAALTAQVAKQHTASVKWQKQTAKLQSEMLHELRTFVEHHDKDETAA